MHSHAWNEQTFFPKQRMAEALFLVPFQAVAKKQLEREFKIRRIDAKRCAMAMGRLDS